jgi:hypothetical protein
MKKKHLLSVKRVVFEWFKQKTIMRTTEEYMTQFAQEHSYETWDQLMYDTHDIFQIQYTKELMLIYAKDILDEAAMAATEGSNDILKLKDELS